MANKYYQKYKESSEMKHMKDIKIHLRKKKIKGKKNPEKDIKILLQKKKKKGICIIRNVSRSYKKNNY